MTVFQQFVHLADAWNFWKWLSEQGHYKSLPFASQFLKTLETKRCNKAFRLAAY